jgi:hypothetical protein
MCVGARLERKAMDKVEAILVLLLPILIRDFLPDGLNQIL